MQFVRSAFVQLQNTTRRQSDDSSYVCIISKPLILKRNERVDFFDASNEWI